MEFRIADTFTAALGKLTRDEQKAVKNSVFDLQINPTMQGFQLHRIDASKDRNFWSVRVNSDVRIIVHKTAASLLLAYVDHHDDAYKWAERRRIEAHPKTGAVQIVEVRERVEEIARPRAFRRTLISDTRLSCPSTPATAKKKLELQPFTRLSEENLLSIGVPEDWVTDILVATEDAFLELATHLPGEASEALLEYVSSGTLKVPAPVVIADPFAHPDTLRRIRVVENAEELEQALSYPWETLDCLPASLAARDCGAGLRWPGACLGLRRHRQNGRRHASREMARSKRAQRPRVARHLLRAAGLLVGQQARDSCWRPVRGHSPDHGRLVSRDRPRALPARPCPKTCYRFRGAIRSLLLKASEAEGAKGLTERFLMSEWTHGVDAWQIRSAQAYADCPRLGRRAAWRQASGTPLADL